MKGMLTTFSRLFISLHGERENQQKKAEQSINSEGKTNKRYHTVTGINVISAYLSSSQISSPDGRRPLLTDLCSNDCIGLYLFGAENTKNMYTK